jgi:ABC-type uncharacterized transport system ATPase subunit
MKDLDKLCTDIKNISEGTQVLHDLVSSLSENRFDKSNSIIVKSIKQISKEINTSTQAFYERYKDSE